MKRTKYIVIAIATLLVTSGITPNFNSGFFKAENTSITVKADYIPSGSYGGNFSLRLDDDNNFLYLSVLDANNKTAAVVGSGLRTENVNIKIPETASLRGANYTITEISDNAFMNQKNLLSVSGMKNVTKIGSQAFYNCSSLNNVTIDWNTKTMKNELNTIGKSAFENCTGLITCSQLFINVEKISENAFKNCSNLSEVNLNSVNELGDSAFMNSGIISADMSLSSCSVIPSKAFADCKNLKKIKMPEKKNLKAIRNEAFSNCTSLDYICIPDTVKFIKEKAFKNNINLKTVLMSENLQEIGNQAFIGCESMEYIVFKNPYTTFSGGFQAGWINQTKKNKKFTVWGNGTRTTASAFASQNGFTYKDINTETQKIINYNNNISEFDTSVQNNVWELTNKKYFWEKNGDYFIDSRLSDYYPENYTNKTDFKGICNGLASLSVLSQNGYYNIKDYIYRLIPDRLINDSVTINSIESGPHIYYPKLKVFVTACWLKYDDISDISSDTQISEEMLKYAEYIGYGADKAKLVMDPCSNYSYGHAVVCEGIEYKKNNPANPCWQNYEGKIEADARLLIYDNNTNAFDDNYCIYINTMTGEWYHPKEEYNISKDTFNKKLKLFFRPETILGDDSIKTSEDVNKFFNDLVTTINNIPEYQIEEVIKNKH